MIAANWDLGDAVRVIRNVRNDGTYPGLATGEPLIRRGSVGHVVDVGTFLQDQIIYSVHFLADDRIVGCREEELIAAADEWIFSVFEFRESVRSRIALRAGEDALLPAGSVGEILRVLRHAADGVAYHVHFAALPGRVFQIPENLLLPVIDRGAA